MDFRADRQPLVSPGGIECHVRDMTATVSADLPLRQLQFKLAEQQQWLPNDGDPAQTLRTLVSFNSTGPLRLGYGAWRDLLLGTQFRTGRGELITAGGRTVKNVAGYDLTKFMVGQMGVFGNLITLTTRTYRMPDGAILARHAPDVGILSRLMTTPLRPQWAVLTADALLCGYLSDTPTLEFVAAAIGKSDPMAWEKRSLEQDMQHRLRLWSKQGQVVFRAAVPPSRLTEFVRSIDVEDWAADAAFGVVLGSVLHDAVGDIVSAAGKTGGRVRISRGQYGPPMELSTNESERRIIEQLKLAFDPDNQLNPLPWRAS